MEAAMAEQPALHGGSLMGAEIVEDDVDVEVVGHVAVDLVQEGHQVGAGMRRADVSDDLAGGDVQGREEIAGAVALIVMGGPLRGGGQHRQRWGGSIESLDLRFLVDGEHRRLDRRVHVQADQIADLLHQVGVGATP
jgi:hypothetical protein